MHKSPSCDSFEYKNHAEAEVGYMRTDGVRTRVSMLYSLRTTPGSDSPFDSTTACSIVRIVLYGGTKSFVDSSCKLPLRAMY